MPMIVKDEYQRLDRDSVRLAVLDPGIKFGARVRRDTWKRRNMIYLPW